MSIKRRHVLITDDLHFNSDFWFPTGYYAKGGDVVTMTFDGPLVNSVAYVQIGQHVKDHSSQEGRSRLITQYQDIVQPVQNFSNPWGGPIYITVCQCHNWIILIAVYSLTSKPFIAIFCRYQHIPKLIRQELQLRVLMRWSLLSLMR